MKIPYRWVGELVELDLSAAQAADRLINAGVEVASVTPLAPDFRGVVAGEIEAIERELGESRGHRLLLCRVSTGRDRYSVVCGAPNTKVGARARRADRRAPPSAAGDAARVGGSRARSHAGPDRGAGSLSSVHGARHQRGHRRALAGLAADAAARRGPAPDQQRRGRDQLRAL